MVQCKTTVTPLLTQWSYCRLALNHRYLLISFGVSFIVTGAIHYNGVIMGTIASQITNTSSRLFSQPFIQTQITENIKASRHCPLCGNSPGTGEFPAQMASTAENASIWWRHHEQKTNHVHGYWEVFHLLNQLVAQYGADKMTFKFQLLRCRPCSRFLRQL